MDESQAKWAVLALAALTIGGSYYTYDSIAPIADMLRAQRGFTQSQTGLLNAVFSLPSTGLARHGQAFWRPACARWGPCSPP